jgi:hypothetical protein
LLGALSVDSGLIIPGGLAAGGAEELAEMKITGINRLSANAAWMHLDCMTNADIINIEMNDATKVYMMGELKADLFGFLIKILVPD